MTAIPSAASTRPDPSRHAAHVCIECGVMCDDIELDVADGRIVAAGRACTLGREALVGLSAAAAMSFVDGRQVPLDEACQRTAELLRQARRPLVCGLRRATTETLRAALALADRYGAAIDWTQGDADSYATLALQTAGAISATWGEVAQRADTIVYLASDAYSTQPRLAERHTEARRSRWLPAGRDNRHVIVIDDASNKTSAAADESVRILPGSLYECLHVLRAIVQGVQLGEEEVRTVTGVELPHWKQLVQRLQAAKFGCVVVGKRLSADSPAARISLTQLLTNLTRTCRWVAVDEAAAGNTAGAASVFTWQAGSPLAIDFAQGVPRYCPQEATTSRLLKRGEVDLVICVGQQVPPNCNVATVLLSDAAHLDSSLATVVIGVARPTIDEAGTLYRSDGVALPARAALSALRPAAAEILNAIRTAARIATQFRAN